MAPRIRAVAVPLSIVSPDDQKVTFVELFFDLVFVYCVTQVASLVHGHFDLKSAGRALLVFWLVWWAWTQFTWALNAANTDHYRVQVVTLLATGIAFLMGVGIPGALGGEALWFAVPYVLVRIVGLLLYYWVAWHDEDQRQAVRVFALFSMGGLVAVIGGAMLGGTLQYWLLVLAVVLDLVAAGIGGNREGWNLHPDHFVERHGLIVIIALGEALIVAAAGLADTAKTPSSVATAILAVAVTCGFWWTYFRSVRRTFEHALASRDGHARSGLARDIFSFLHFPMLCGVIAMAAATEEALAHPDRTMDTGARVFLAVGAVLFVCGTAAATWRATGRSRPWRWILTPLVAAAVTMVATAPWMAMALLLGMLVVIGTLEHAPHTDTAEIAEA